MTATNSSESILHHGQTSPPQLKPLLQCREDKKAGVPKQWRRGGAGGVPSRVREASESSGKATSPWPLARSWAPFSNRLVRRPPLASGGGTQRAGHSRDRLRTPRTARDKDPRRSRGAPPTLGPLLVQTQPDRCGSPKLHGVGGAVNKSPSLPGSAKSMGSVWLLKSWECASNPPAGRTARAGPSRERGPDAPAGSFPHPPPR